MKELRKNDTPWDALTCTAAAKGGHLNVLLWARANGCPRDDDELLYTAAQFALEVMVQALIELGTDVNKAADNGATPLYVAAQKGNEAVVRARIKASVDVNKAADDGMTPLLMAAQNGHESAVVRALIEAGADVNKAGINGTPLFIAAFASHESVVRARIELGADVNKARKNGITPLSVSRTPISNVAQGEHAAIVQILRDAGTV